jgi:osmotically-inducible protein OsmY
MRHLVQSLALVALLVSVASALEQNAANVQRMRMTDPHMADEILLSKVEQQLRLDDRVDWELLKVKAEQGEVTLFGKVATLEEKGWAESIAGSVPGVKGLTNLILVVPALEPDHRIKMHVRQAFKNTNALQGNDTLRISVENGVVKLQGDVRGRMEETAALRAAESVPGVQNVISELTLVQNVPSKAEREGTGRNPTLGGDGERQVVP